MHIRAISVSRNLIESKIVNGNFYFFLPGAVDHQSHHQAWEDVDEGPGGVGLDLSVVMWTAHGKVPLNSRAYYQVYARAHRDPE